MSPPVAAVPWPLLVSPPPPPAYAPSEIPTAPREACRLLNVSLQEKAPTWAWRGEYPPVLTPAARTSARESGGHPSPFTPVLLQGGSGRSQLPAEVAAPSNISHTFPTTPFPFAMGSIDKMPQKSDWKAAHPSEPSDSTCGTKAANEREKSNIKNPREVQAPARDGGPLLQGRLGREEQRGSCPGRRHRGPTMPKSHPGQGNLSTTVGAGESRNLRWTLEMGTSLFCRSGSEMDSSGAGGRQLASSASSSSSRQEGEVAEGGGGGEDGVITAAPEIS